MCEYIKDDGEQCGIDSHNGDYCHLHEEKESVADAVRGSSADFDGQMMDESCDDCGTPLRRTERLREHPNYPHRTVFEAVVECDCAEYVLGSKSVTNGKLCGGWV